MSILETLLNIDITFEEYLTDYDMATLTRSFSVRDSAGPFAPINPTLGAPLASGVAPAPSTCAAPAPVAAGQVAPVAQAADLDLINLLSPQAGLFDSAPGASLYELDTQLFSPLMGGRSENPDDLITDSQMVRGAVDAAVHADAIRTADAELRTNLFSPTLGLALSPPMDTQQLNLSFEQAIDTGFSNALNATILSSTLPTPVAVQPQETNAASAAAAAAIGNFEFDANFLLSTLIGNTDSELSHLAMLSNRQDPNRDANGLFPEPTPFITELVHPVLSTDIYPTPRPSSFSGPDALRPDTPYIPSLEAPVDLSGQSITAATRGLSFTSIYPTPEVLNGDPLSATSLFPSTLGNSLMSSLEREFPAAAATSLVNPSLFPSLGGSAALSNGFAAPLTRPRPSASRTPGRASALSSPRLTTALGNFLANSGESLIAPMSSSKRPSTSATPGVAKRQRTAQGSSTIGFASPATENADDFIGTGASTPLDEDHVRRKHVCPHPGCGRRFERKFNLDTHTKTHAPDQGRDFSCSSCEKKFSRRHDLQRHMASVHNSDQMHACTTCKKSFSRRDALARHVQSKCAINGNE